MDETKPSVSPAPTPQPVAPSPTPTPTVDPRSIYPDPVAATPAPPAPTFAASQQPPDRYGDASVAFSDAKVLICGVASATAYLLVIYISKNVYITAAVSAILALAAIFFAITSYGKSGKLGPLSVIGLSAATITLVYIANILLALVFVHSILTSGYMF